MGRILAHDRGGRGQRPVVAEEGVAVDLHERHEAGQVRRPRPAAGAGCPALPVSRLEDGTMFNW
ncbi:hypothetical protein [Nonomuraea sp. KM90]|uniref:hypothetical protein n=1 Tax=Nonomuraea sp. KM90 TaxID=3457428 RepID=UPI003FCCB0BF